MPVKCFASMRNTRDSNATWIRWATSMRPKKSCTSSLPSSGMPAPGTSFGVSGARFPLTNPPERELRQLAATNPTLENLDSLRRPRAVTGHGAGTQTLENAIRVRAHVIIGSEVEVPQHRLTVFRAKQRFDLGGELDGFIGSGRAHTRILPRCC